MMPGYSRMPPRATMYGPDFVHTARPCQVIAGTVTDKATGKPLAGINVNGSEQNGWWENAVYATTDAQGRYRLVGLPKAPQRRLSFFAKASGTPVLTAGFTVNDVEGTQPITFDVGLVRGVVVTGRVTDKATGKPIRDAGLHYNPLAGNSFFDKTPGTDV